MFGVLREVRAQLAGLAGTLDPDTVTVDEAARAIGARNIWSQAVRALGFQAFMARKK